MRGYVATTDYDWFRFLRVRQPLDEVNFWQPSAHGFNAQPGTPFFFKLKAPHYAIGGVGVFARYEAATPRLAWEAFGQNNGTATFEEMRARIAGYARSEALPGHRIGCIMVSQPVFFADEDLVEQPRDWKKNVVSGAGYELAEGEGRRVWDQCQAQVARLAGQPISAGLVKEPVLSPAARFGEPQLVRPRLGQGTFRVAVTAAYGGACAISGEHSLPALEAAHIRPYASQNGTHEVTNGLLLRADIHRLFDKGYVTVTPEHRFVVSERLAREWENGRAYYAMQGKTLALPPGAADQPDPAALQWHNEAVFEKDAA